MVTPRTVQSWQPASLADTADALVTRRSTLIRLGDELDRGAPPSSWESAEVEPAQASHLALKTQLAAQTDELRGVIAALDTAAAAIRTAQQDLSGAVGRAYSHGMGVNLDSGDVWIDALPMDEADREYALRVSRECADDISAAVTAASQADADLAAALQVANTSDPTAAPSLDTQLDLDTLAGMSTRDQVQYLIDHPEDAENLLPYLPDDVKTALGTELGNQLDQLGLSPETAQDQDEIARLQSLMDAYATDAVVAAGLFEELGPDGTAAALSTINAYTGYGIDNPALGTLADTIRSSMATATTAPGFNGEAFGKGVVESLTPPIEEEYEKRYGQNGVMGGASSTVLTYLLEGQGYSDSFVKGAAAAVDAFERQDPQLSRSWYGWAAGGGLPTALYPPDPMAAVMNQFVDHPVVGRDFFADSTRSGDSTVGTDRAAYYFAERDWRQDEFGSVSAAVEAIAADPTNQNAANRAATSLVMSQFFDWITDNDDFSIDNAEAASPHIGNILKMYTPLIDKAITGDTQSGDPGVFATDMEIPYYGTLADAPLLFSEDLKDLMKVAVSTEDGMTHVAEGIGAYRQTQLNGIAVDLANATPAHREELEGALRRIAESGGRLEGYAQGVINDVEIGSARDADERIATFSKLVTAAAGLVPLPGADEVGELGSRIIKFGYLQSVNLGQDAFNEHFASQEEVAIYEQNAESKVSLAAMKYNTYAAMVSAGIIPMEDVPESWLDNGRFRPFESIVIADGGSVAAVVNEVGNQLTPYNITDANLDSAYTSRFEEMVNK